MNAQSLLILSNDDELATSSFYYSSKFVNDWQEEVASTYSGIDVGFYDSPSGITITPHTTIQQHGYINFNPVPSQTSQTREIAWWEYAILAALVGPIRILRFPMWLIEGGKRLVGSPEDMPQ